jgi:hypothetical protein
MLSDDPRPVGPGTRLLTVLVAPFVAAWMAADASIGLVGRFVRHAARVVIDSLRALRRATGRVVRGTARRAAALVAAVVGLVGELPHFLDDVAGPAIRRAIVLVKQLAHGVAAGLRSFGRAVAALTRRLGVALRALITLVLRPFRWAGRLLARLGARLVVLLRAIGHHIARGLRGLGHAMATAVHLAGRGVRRIWRTVLAAAAAAARGLRSVWASVIASTVAARTAIRAAVRDARSGVRLAIGDARRAIRQAFSVGRGPTGPSN